MERVVTGSKELIRDINSTLVLETIIQKGTVSRAAIAKELGLTKATVSAIVQGLLERKLVKEIGSDDTSFGRKPILLQFCDNAGYGICVDVGVEQLSAIRTNLSGRGAVLVQGGTPREPQRLAGAISRLVESLMGSAPQTSYGLVGIALGIHGAVKDNVITFAPYYDIAGMNLVGQLEERFSVPVLLENEANLSVLGEETFIYDYPILANISVHTGIGLGVVVNHELYTGFDGNAGEIGHTIVEVDGRPCPCGNRGCLEQYVSERALLAEFSRRKGLAEIDMDSFFEYYRKKDSDAVAILDDFVLYMSVCVNNVLNSFNPDIVVINSLFVVNSPSLIRRIEEHLSSRVNHYRKIVPSGLQDASILLGGICMVARRFLGVNRLHFEFLH